ncbi:hypothetical protein LDENG_00279340 [Lucifuga dentata]|nr:hypothetical protein LDENG_00279340 [Lucifuga dentata]
MPPKRSIVWNFFKKIDTASLVQCQICGSSVHRHGNTSTLLRHMRIWHPTEFSIAKERAEIVTVSGGFQPMETNSDQPCSVEVTLEDSDSAPTENETVMHSSLDAILKASGISEQESQRKEINGNIPSTCKRSLIWQYFDDLGSAGGSQCQICMKTIHQCKGSTSNLLRHMAKKHPRTFSLLTVKGKISQATNKSHDSTDNSHTSIPVSEQLSVEVTLEDSDSAPTENETVMHSSLDAILKASGISEQESQRKEINGNIPSTTSNLLRHMAKKHPRTFSLLTVKGKISQATNKSHDSTDNSHTYVPVTEQRSVEVALEDGDPTPTENEADINSASNGILEASGVSEKQRSDNSPSKDKWSLIWKYYERLESENGSECLICMKKIHHNSGSTNNLLQHMSKRHPQTFFLVAAKAKKTQSTNTLHRSADSGHTSTPESQQVSDRLKASRTKKGEKPVLSRERELIEALRRVQKEEAQALEHQRELLEQLCAVNAREAAVEKERIEFLRKTQEEEAKELSRQREELQREKEDLQKKWQQLQQEKEEFHLFRDQQA